MSPRARLADERGIIAGSLIRYVLILVLLGLVAIEGGSIVFAHISLQNAADKAAIEAAEVWENSLNINAASAAALQSLQDQQQNEAEIVSVEGDRAPTFELRLVVAKQANTLLVHRIGFLEGLARVEAEAKHRPVETGV